MLDDFDMDFPDEEDEFEDEADRLGLSGAERVSPMETRRS